MSEKTYLVKVVKLDDEHGISYKRVAFGYLAEKLDGINFDFRGTGKPRDFSHIKAYIEGLFKESDNVPVREGACYIEYITGFGKLIIEDRCYSGEFDETAEEASWGFLSSI